MLLFIVYVFAYLSNWFSMSSFFSFITILKIYFFVFDCTGSSLLRALSLVVLSSGCPSSQGTGISLQQLLLLQSTALVVAACGL